MGVQHATPGTDGHAFFILGILLCGLLLMTTIVGCYGICSEILGVNVIVSMYVQHGFKQRLDQVNNGIFSLYIKREKVENFSRVMKIV